MYEANVADVQRRWVVQRLQVVDEGWAKFSAGEKARLKQPLLAYIEKWYPGILAIVEKQFTQEDHP